MWGSILQGRCPGSPSTDSYRYNPSLATSLSSTSSPQWKKRHACASSNHVYDPIKTPFWWSSIIQQGRFRCPLKFQPIICAVTGQGGTPLWQSSSAMFHQSPSLCLNMARTFVRATVLSYQSLWVINALARSLTRQQRSAATLLSNIHIYWHLMTARFGFSGIADILIIIF